MKSALSIAALSASASALALQNYASESMLEDKLDTMGHPGTSIYDVFSERCGTLLPDVDYNDFHPWEDDNGVVEIGEYKILPM